MNNSKLNLYKKFHVEIPEKYRTDILQTIIEINIFRIKLICLVFVIFGSLLLMIDYQTLHAIGQPEFHHYYLFSDTILIGLGCIFFPILLWIKKIELEKQKLKQIVISVIMIVFICWTGLVGALEYFTHNSVSTIIVGVLIFASVPYLKGRIVFLAYTLTIITFIICKSYLSDAPVNFFIYHNNLIGICLFGWLLSRILYMNKVDNFLNHQKIMEKNELLASEILERKNVQKKLEKAHKVLEQRIHERTQKLLLVNEELKNEMRERKKMEHSLQQARKMESIGTLAGGIAHDFNNILFPIVGHAELLIEDIPEDSPHRLSVNEIYSGALRAKDLVKQILTFSRKENSEVKLMKIQPIINEVLKLIRSSIPTTISIEVEIDEDCGIIKADPTQIHQIIMNLTTNAYQAMQESGGEMIVKLKEVFLTKTDVKGQNIAPGDYVCLIVSDTGIGIDEDVQQKIYDPFYTTKEQGQGTGMGLSVVHGIVKSIGGDIQLISEPGKGSEFIVFFPKEKSSIESFPFKPDESLKKGSERVLLVDDEESVIIIVREILERLGYQVTSCNDSKDALDIFRKNSDRFDLVITDMAMPKMAGDQLSSELVSIRPDIPILLCTGFSETMSEQKAASLGIKGFLMKPIVIKALSNKLREVLDDIQS